MENNITVNVGYYYTAPAGANFMYFLQINTDLQSSPSSEFWLLKHAAWRYVEMLCSTVYYLFYY